MKKNKKILAVIIVALAIIALVVARNQKAVVGDCCQVAADKCASGPTVTEQVCTDELGGVHNPGEKCSKDTGVCG